MLPGPVMALILSFTTFTLILGLTSSQSLLRPAFLPLMLIYIYVGSFHYPFVHPLYASLIGGSVFGGALHYIDHVLLSRWTFSARGPTSALGGQLPVISSSKGNSSGDGTIGSAKLRSRALSSSASPASSESSESSAPCTPSSGALSTIASRLWWAASHFFECRFNNTPWEVANVPPFSRRDAAAVPSRISFVSYSTAVSVVCILLVDAARLLNGPPEVNAVLFAEDRVKLLMRLGDVTTEEMVLRFMSAILYWTVAYFLIQGVYSGVAAVMVGLWLSDVQRWKPLFGRLTDAWSVRQFWG